MKIKFTLLSIMVLSLASLSSTAQAGMLDNTFDTDGKLTLELGSSYEEGRAVLIQPDGKIVIVSNLGSGTDFHALRLNSNGSYDLSFDTDGKVQTNIAGSDVAYSAVLQADGKIVVAGYSTNSGNWDFTLVRYNTDGSLDNTFDVDGKLLTDFGSNEDKAYSIALQSDGKIVVAGSTGSGTNHNFAVARYNSDGSLDNTFDGDGKLTTDFGSNQEEEAYSVAIQPDGKIVVAGHSYYDVAVIRYDTNGSIDASFDGDGKKTTSLGSGNEYAYAVAVQADGKIITAGGYNNDFAILRYNNDGSFDNTFDTDGQVVTTFTTSSTDMARSIAIQPDGKIIVAGSSNSRFGIIRYNVNGSLDNTFDLDGMNTTFFPSSTNSGAYSVALQADGKIVAIGFTQTGGTNLDLAIARYHGDLATNLAETDLTDIASFYPNPSTGILNIDLYDSKETELTIYNVTGQKLFSKNLIGEKSIIDIAHFSNGLYTLHLKNENGVSVKKIIISK